MIAAEPLVTGGLAYAGPIAARLTRQSSGRSSPSKLPAPQVPHVSPPVAEFAAGACAEFAKVSCVYPLEVVCNRMACSSPGLYSNMFDCVRQTFQGEGIRGFYKGILATYCSSVGNGTIGFGVYGCTLAFFNKHNNVGLDARDSLQSVVAASATSGLFCTAFECPLAIMAIQLQTQQTRGLEGQLAASGENFTCALHQSNAAQRARYATELRYGYDGIRDAFQSMVRHRTFYLGGGPLLCKNLIFWTATFCTFDQTKAFAARAQFGDDSKTAQKGLSISSKIACASVTGIVAWGSCFPFEVIKANMMGQPLEARYRNFECAFTCARQLYTEGGVQRLYRGFTPAMVRSVPAYIVSLNTYDFVRQRLGCL